MYTDNEKRAVQQAKTILYAATENHETECECALCNAALILFVALQGRKFGYLAKLSTDTDTNPKRRAGRPSSR